MAGFQLSNPESKRFPKILMEAEHQKYMNIAVQETYISNENTLITQNNLMLHRLYDRVLIDKKQWNIRQMEKQENIVV